MIVQFLDAPDYTIDIHGCTEQRSSWLLSRSPEESGDISDLALQWAGNVGDPARRPNAGGDNFELDDTLCVTNIKCTALDSRSCRVTFTAVSGSNSSLPDTGNDPTQEATPSGVWQQIRDEFTDDGEFKIASIIIPDDILEDFLTEHAVHTAAEWASDDYYVYSMKTEPAELPQHTLVTATARKSKLQMIENLRTEEVTSTAFGQLQTLSVWKSRWRATAADREIFSTKLGTSAADWTGDENTIVSKITPKRVSDCEFEYLLEARYPVHISSSSGDHRDHDLPDRLEYYIRIGEMRLSAMQCGYIWRYSGRYTPINNWYADQLCPLTTTVALPLHWINQRVKVLEIVEVSYLAGNSGENIAEAAMWFAGPKVETLTLAGITGNFLHSDLDVDDVFDSYDREWTRIRKVYRLAPANHTWNIHYWI